MSQHSLAIANEAGAAFRGDVNNALQALASQSSGASAPGTTYVYQVWADTTNNLVKRRNAANSAWLARDTLLEAFVVSRSSNTILAGSDFCRTLRCTSSFTQTFTAAATLADGWWCEVINDNAAGGGVITLDPNAAETIDGAATLVLNPGEGCVINCNGSSFFTVGRPSRYIGMPRSYLAGLGLSRNATITKLDVAAGKCRDSTDAADIVLTAAITAGLIQTSGAWAAGSTQNKLDTGARANSTWYHVHAIRKDSDGTGDWLFSLSATAPTLPSGYTFFRRIGAVLTDGSGNVTDFVQNGDLFQWKSIVADVAAGNPGTAAVTRTLSVPTGVAVKATMNAGLVLTTTAGVYYALLSDLNTSDVGPAAGNANLSGFVDSATDSAAYFSSLQIMTNTSAQIRSRLGTSSAAVTLDINTTGWIDRRGQDA